MPRWKKNYLEVNNNKNLTWRFDQNFKYKLIDLKGCFKTIKLPITNKYIK